jgi:hypothetical protein
MNKEQLKELVMQHFNLVPASTPEKFGSLEDINSAFTLTFPGDAPKVGDKVKVVTSEGQEGDAPDGYHEMKDGTMIKTEGSVITEIEAKEEMSKVDPGDEVAEEITAPAVKEVAFGADPAKSQVEGTTAQNSDTVIDGAFEDFKAEVSTKMADLETKIAECMAAMEGMKGKFSSIASEPASERTLPAGVVKADDDIELAHNAGYIKNLIEQYKNKK